MRPHVRAFLEAAVIGLPIREPVVEIGSRLPAGQERLADLRPLFAGKRFVGCDMEPGPGVDRVEDLASLGFADGEVGTFVLADTLEHVRDPFGACAELHRTLAPDGVLILTTVMHFPIHAHPNDYWRFTPEALRSLLERFACVAVFAAGDPGFPHTVAAVARKQGERDALLGVIDSVQALPVNAPLQLERRAAQQIRRLALRNLEGAARAEVPAAQGSAGFGPGCNAQGWTLVEGQWIDGWVADARAEQVEVRAGERVLFAGPLHPLGVAERRRLQSPDAPDVLGFRGQVRLGGAEFAGVLALSACDAQGTPIARVLSRSGIALGALAPEPGFALHSFDVRSGADPAAEGRALVAALAARNEPVVVDLGCGVRREGNIGVDWSRSDTQADLECRLGFEPIPLPDAVADRVFSRDFLEHLPKGVWIERERRMLYPVIDLVNEIWRILKPGGEFESWTPCHPHPEVHQDPTHLSVWTAESMQYFCGKYPVAERYGVRARFEVIELAEKRFYLYARLRKPA